MKHLFVPTLLLLLCGCAAKTPMEARLPTMPPELFSAREPGVKNPPLPQAVAAWLEKRAAALVAGERVRPPKGWTVAGVGIGDLNGDDREDLAVVLEELPPGASRPDGHEPGPRHLAVLLTRPDGIRKIAHANAELVLDRASGGAFGDPFAGITVQDGALWIKHYGGSNFRWGFAMEFRYVDGLFRLARLERLNMYTGTANGEVTACDFLRGTVERRAWSGLEPGRNELLYSGKMDAKAYLFDETDFDTAAANTEILFLPRLGYYDFDRSMFPAPPPLRISPDEALTRIHAARHPELTEMRLPLTPEMKAAYSKLLGYEIPGRYYQGGEGVLEYLDLEIADDGEGRATRVGHTIVYTHMNPNLGDVMYEIHDADGTIREQ